MAAYNLILADGHYKRTPVEMLCALVNTTNGTTLDAADFQTKNLTAEPHADAVTYPAHNTSVELDITSDDVVDNFVKLSYIRVALDQLFSLAAPSIRQVDVELGQDGMPVDVAAFYTELERKYSVRLAPADVTLSLKAPGVLTVTANAANLVYISAFDVNVGSSLAARVAKVRLDGFSASSVAATAPFVPA